MFHWQMIQKLIFSAVRRPGIHGGERLNVEPVLKAVDMADPNVEHLGVMAYAAYFQWVKARPKPCDRLKIIPDGKTVRVHNPVRKRNTTILSNHFMLTPFKRKFP